MGQPLCLAAHVRVCEVDDQFVLLDLKQGRYVGVDPQQGRQLGAVIDGWPAVQPAPATPTDIAPLIEPLLAKGLVTPVSADRRRAAAIEIDEATASLDQTDITRINGRHLARFSAATALSALRLKCCSLSAIAEHVARQRTRRSAADSMPLEQLRHQTAVFQTLRPLVFTARDKCLYDSLALVTFLAFEGLHPRWVIGVKTNPFRAHSWVQADGVVLNDLHENVGPFRPILVV